MSKVESADLILKLYDLRREKKMRKARDWMFSFNPTSADDIMQTMMNPDVGPYLRMVTSYWDMCAVFVNEGAIEEGFSTRPPASTLCIRQDAAVSCRASREVR